MEETLATSFPNHLNVGLHLKNVHAGLHPALCAAPPTGVNIRAAPKPQDHGMAGVNGVMGRGG